MASAVSAPDAGRRTPGARSPLAPAWTCHSRQSAVRSSRGGCSSLRASGSVTSRAASLARRNSFGLLDDGW